MEQIKASQRGFRWRLVAAVLSPFAAASTYLVLTRWPSDRFTTFGDYAGLAVSMLVGAAFIVTLPIQPRQRVLSLLIYVPVFAALLFAYAFLFIALIFHDGL